MATATPTRFVFALLTAALLVSGAPRAVAESSAPTTRPVINTSMGYLVTLAADCAAQKPGAFESADAIAKRLIERDGLPRDLPPDVETRAIECMLKVFLLNPQRNNVYRYLAQAPAPTANEIAAKDGKERLAQLALIRLDFFGEDTADITGLFALTTPEVIAAARATLWPLELGPQRDRTGAELAGSFRGRVAEHVLSIHAGNNNSLRMVTLIDERLYCFETQANEGIVVVINRSGFSVRPGDERRPVRILRSSGKNKTIATYLPQPAPLAGLAIMPLGERRNAPWPNNDMPLPDWLKQFVPDDFPLSVEFFKTENPPTIKTPADPHPRYVKPDIRPKEMP